MGVVKEKDEKISSGQDGPEIKINFDKRLIILSADINENSSSDIMESVELWNMNDSDLMIDKRKRIKLVVNTYGGSWNECVAICNIIRLSKTPIDGYCYSKALSAGLWIFAHCHKRYATKQSLFLYHDFAADISGRLDRMNIDIKKLNEKQEIADDMLLNCTKIKRTKLKEVKERADNNWTFYGEEALILGVVDELLGEEDDK